nr:interferon lambda-4 isoform X1 [Chlorocebus sabaeus]
MRPSVWAAVAAGLWVLCTVVTAAPRRCLLSHYRSLETRTLAAAKALRDRYEEEALRWEPRNCSFRPRRDPPRPSVRPGSGRGRHGPGAAPSNALWSLQSCAQLRHVARGIADAQAVLSGLHHPELLPGAGPILELLAAAGRDVAACLELSRPGSSRKVPGAQRRRHKPRRADSPRCREVSVIFNLLRLLTWELRLVAHSGPCL